jgi:hypothetical protein
MFGHGHGRGLAQEKERADDAVGTLRRLLRYFRPYGLALALVGALLIVGSAVEVGGPYLSPSTSSSFQWGRRRLSGWRG